MPAKRHYQRLFFLRQDRGMRLLRAHRSIVRVRLLWRKHIGFAVDYTQGVVTQDRNKQDRAVADLVQYTQDFGAFLISANPNLPKDVVSDLVKTHVLTLKEVIDVQAYGNAAQAYVALRHAAGHMTMIANPLADAIVKQFPAKYTI